MTSHSRCVGGRPRSGRRGTERHFGKGRLEKGLGQCPGGRVVILILLYIRRRSLASRGSGLCASEKKPRTDNGECASVRQRRQGALRQGALRQGALRSRRVRICVCLWVETLLLLLLMVLLCGLRGRGESPQRTVGLLQPLLRKGARGGRGAPHGGDSVGNSAVGRRGRSKGVRGGKGEGVGKSGWVW